MFFAPRNGLSLPQKCHHSAAIAVLGAGAVRVLGGCLLGASLLAALGWSEPVRAEIRTPKYNYNRLYFSDTSAANRYVKKQKTWKGWSDPLSSTGWSGAAYSSGGTYSHRPLSRQEIANNKAKFHAIISDAARHYNLPKPLLEAVITAESAYNPRAVSTAGAQGLMQLMPSTARRYGVRDPFNPAQNIHGGSRYLSDLMAMFNNDLNLVLAAYNAGEGAVIRYGRQVPPYDETRRYVQKVKAYYSSYR